jgi:hypothetical protein
MNNVIALNPILCPLIGIQTTLVQRNKIIYLNTVNILFENKIIEKIRLNDKMLENNKENIHQITRDYFISKLKPRKKNVNFNKKKETKQLLVLWKNLI